MVMTMRLNEVDVLDVDIIHFHAFDENIIENDDDVVRDK